MTAPWPRLIVGSLCIDHQFFTTTHCNELRFVIVAPLTADPGLKPVDYHYNSEHDVRYRLFAHACVGR